MKVTRKNIGYYHIELNGRKFEISKNEGGEWNVGEMRFGYGVWSIDSYDETFWTFRDCKGYIRGVAQ